MTAGAGAPRLQQLGLGADPTARQLRTWTQTPNCRSQPPTRGAMSGALHAEATALPDPEIYELLLTIRADFETVTRDGGG